MNLLRFKIGYFPISLLLLLTLRICHNQKKKKAKCSFIWWIENVQSKNQINYEKWKWFECVCLVYDENSWLFIDSNGSLTETEDHNWIELSRQWIHSVCVCVCESVDDFSHTVGKCMKRMTWSMGPTKTDRDTCDILNEWQNSFYKDPQEEIRKSINFQLKKTNLINME